MNSAIGIDAGDDLVGLWQDTRLPGPDPEKLARRVAAMALRRFDRVIAWRNLREYAGSLLVLLFAVWRWRAGGERLQASAMIVAVLIVSGALWWQHRRVRSPDPAADARSYQAALLARIDHQIRLLGTVRYWYLLPLYLPVLLQVGLAWPTHPVSAIITLVVVTAIYVGLARLNERLAVGLLRQERARVASLYADDEA
jgi:hypothetical protein